MYPKACVPSAIDLNKNFRRIIVFNEFGSN
jgi:hypothetical protein